MRSFLVICSLICLAAVHLYALEPREYFKFAKFQYDKGEYSKALDYINQAIEEDTLYVNAYFLRSQIFYESGQYYRSINDINRLLKFNDPASSMKGEYHLTRAKCYMELNNYDLAESDLLIARDVMKDDPGVIFAQSMLSSEKGDLTSALAHVNEAIEKESGKPEYYAFRSQVKMEGHKSTPGSDEYQSALTDINVAIALDQDNYRYYEIRSQYLKSLGDDDAALTDYDKIIELSPESDVAYTERGLAKMQSYDYRDAVSDFSQAIELNPNDGHLFRYRGLCYNNLGSYNTAYRDFTRSIELLTGNLKSTSENNSARNILAETYLLRGHCLNLMGNNSQACRDFLMAHNLGVKKGLNYYRKFCGIY